MRRIACRGIVAACVIAASGFGSMPAVAQAVDPYMLAEAEALHERAVHALDKEDYATACPLLEKVVRMIPEGLGARETLAECYESLGRLASAWRTYDELAPKAAAAGRNDQSTRVGLKAIGLRPKLAGVTLTVPRALRGQPGLEVRIGQEVVPPGALGVPVLLDVGEHVVSLRTAGGVRWETRVRIETNGARILVEIPSNVAGAAKPRAPTEAAPGRRSGPPSPTQAPRPAPVRAAKAVEPDSAAETGGNMLRDAGIFSGIVGLASLGVGIFFLAQAKKDESLRVVSRIMIASGAAGTGASIMLLLTARGTDAPAGSVSPHPRRSMSQVPPGIGPHGVIGTVRTTF